MHARKIAVNALKDEDEADKILKWLQNKINTAWKNHKTIEPSFESAPRADMNFFPTKQKKTGRVHPAFNAVKYLKLLFLQGFTFLYQLLCNTADKIIA